MTSERYDGDGQDGQTAVRPGRAGSRSSGLVPAEPADERSWEAAESARGAHLALRVSAFRPVAYWTGLLALVAGLAATVGTLASQVTSIVQTVLAAIPLFLVGLGLERVGRGLDRRSLRGVGALLAVVAVAAPVTLSLSSSSQTELVTDRAPVPPGVSQGLLRARLGSGDLHVSGGGVALYEAELRSPGRPRTGWSVTDSSAVVDLGAPAQRGLLARNRGSDWRVRLSTALPWRVEVEAAALTADLDLQQLDVRGLRVDAGVSRLAVRLGAPATQTGAELRVSTGFVDLYLPRAAACELRVEGVALNNFPEAGLVRRGEVWATPEASGAGRYRITVVASGARVRVHRV